MNWKNVKLIFLREVRDQLRDRRTLFMVAVLPLLLYPALGVGMTYMTVNFSEQERTVVILGAGDLPPPPLLDLKNPDRFLPEYFDSAGDANKLRVITEANIGQPLEKGRTEEEQKAEQEFLKQAVELRGTLEQLGVLSRARAAAQEKSYRLSYAGPEQKAELAASNAHANELKSKEAALKAQVDLWFSTAPIQVMIVVPTGFATKLEEANRQLATRTASDTQLDEMPRPLILQNSADEKSQLASRRIREALEKWENRLRDARLEQAGLPRSVASPVDLTSIDVAAKSDLSANLWSKLFPALLVMMGVTGAFYPAIDLGAGEKERGTMETLLISPAKRSEIVMGKFMTVMLFSISTAILNMLSMGLTGQHVLTMAAGGAGAGAASFPSLVSLVWVLVLAIPLSALFSATSLALAMFASSSKEGQYYLTPLLMVTMGLTMFCLSPAIEIQPYYSILPVAGPALLLKALLAGGSSISQLSVYFLPVIGSSIFYSVVALNWAISLFDREEVLFREAERFDMGLWIKHILRDKDPVPSKTEAAICFAIVVLTQFAAMSSMKPSFDADSLTNSLRVLKWQTIFLIATVGVPPALMAVLLTSSVRRTLKLYWPQWQYLALGIVLPIVLQPIAIELIHQMEWFFPKLPAEMGEFMKKLSDPNVKWYWPLLAIAVTPAICEEVAFRGFLLSGLQSGRQRSFWTPILISAVCFGVVHMIAHQVFNAMLLGIVLGLLAVRSRSLIPGVIFHFIFNGMQVLQSRIPEKYFEPQFMQWLFSFEGESGQRALRFNAPVLAVSGVLSVVLISWLVKTPPDSDVEGPHRRFADLPPVEGDSTALPLDDARWEEMRRNANQGERSL